MGALLAVLAFGLGSVSMAEPVRGEQAVMPPGDTYDLASRWALASLSTPITHGTWQSLNVELAPPPAPRWTPFAPIVGRVDGADAADPTAYALLGAALVVTGLLARRWRRRQRGLS